jgi:ribose/xylose/arabinose/galactoside ABC-type transport system permease subunit
MLARHSPLVILAALCVCLALLSDKFSTAGNLQTLALRTSEIGVMAVGQLLVILTAGIDLSVGSVAALSGVVATKLMKFDVPVVLSVAAGLGTGLLCGLVNGLLVTLGRIPPFIVTLGMMMAARGMALLVSEGYPISGLPDSFAWLGGGKAWFVPVLITLAVVAACAVLLNFTPFGRGLYAMGGNRAAARLSGLPVVGYRTGAFALCGMLAGLAGVMLASRTTIGSGTAAEMMELDAIAACVIGGTSLMGGEGGAVGALAGALIMVVLQNYCNLENINVHLQRIFVGVLIVALVFYDNYRKRRAGLLPED